MSLNEVRELSDKEAEEIVEALHMNIGERKRFLRGVKALQSSTDEEGFTGTDGKGGPSQVPGAKDSRAPPAHQQDEDLDALRAELERQREELMEQKRQQEELERQRQKELEEIERKRRAEEMQQRRQQELLEQQQELLEQKRQEQLELQKELEKKRQQQLQQEENEELMAKQQPVKPFEWFMVVKSMVFIKATPHKDAETLIFVKRGEWLQVHSRRHLDDETNQWAELSERELQRRGGRGPPMRGFALIDGTEMGLGRLLEGPFETGEGETGAAKGAAVVRARQEVELEEDDEEDVYVARPLLNREQTIATNWPDEEARLAELWASDGYRRADQLPRGLKVFQAVYPAVYMKRSADPSTGAITRLSCKVGACFLSTGAEWEGPQGGQWVEQYTPDGAARWLLVEGPGFQTDGPMLLDEGSASDHVLISVTYAAPRQSICLFRTFMNKHATVGKLCSRFCSATGLSPKAAMLVPKASPSASGIQHQGLMAEPQMASHILEPHKTLLSYGYRVEGEVFLAYASNFEDDYRGGILLKEV